jgi:hypothetical protein
MFDLFEKPLQSWKIWYWLNIPLVLSVLYFFGISILQEMDKSGTVKIAGIEFSQFYTGTSIRLSPYIYVIFLLIPILKKIVQIEKQIKVYFDQFLLSLLLFTDSYTHVNSKEGYHKSFNLPIWGEFGVDKLMHFLTGVTFGIILTHLLILKFAGKKKPIFNKKNLLEIWNFGFNSFTTFFVVWEIIELLVQKFLGVKLIPTKFDTSEDLMFNSLGYILGYISCIFIFIGYKAVKHNKKLK